MRLHIALLQEQSLKALKEGLQDVSFVLCFVNVFGNVVITIYLSMFLFKSKSSMVNPTA